MIFILSIGIIDSGLGAISVLNHLISLKKYANYILFLDYLFNPFGEKSEEVLLDRLKTGVSFLKEKGCKQIIIACNTLSIIALKYHLKDVITPVFYVQKILLSQPLNNLAILATKYTCESKVYLGNCYNESPLVRYIEGTRPLNLSSYLKKYENQTLLLGCTHFYLLFKKQKNMKIIDSGFELAKNIHFKNEKLSVLIYLSKVNPNIINHLYFHLHLQKVQIALVDI